MRSSVAVVAVLLAATAAHAAPKAAKPSAKPAKTAVPIVSEDDLVGTLKKHKGKPVVLHFWATWCLPCIAELPEVAAIAQAAKDKGIEFVAVSLDDPTPPAAAKVKSVLAERLKGAAFATTILKIDDADKFVAKIDPRWEGDIPVFFAYDTSGQLRRAFVGELKRKDFDKFIADLAP